MGRKGRNQGALQLSTEIIYEIIKKKMPGDIMNPNLSEQNPGLISKHRYSQMT